MSAGAIIFGLSHQAALANDPQQYITTPTDNIPDFAQNPTIRSVSNGDWSATATWDAGRLPTATDIVEISPTTHVVLTDQAEVAGVIGIESGGSLTFSTSVPTRLTVGTLLDKEGGDFEMGASGAPITSTAELVFADRPLDLANDPSQFGTGLVSLGRVRIAGTPKSNTFSPLAGELHAGDTSLTFAQAVPDWQAGDTLVVPDTRELYFDQVGNSLGEIEERIVSSVSADHKTVTLSQALAYDHLGARDGSGVLKMLGHVADISRNVTVRSANPAGTRGHTLYTRYADVDIEYAQFADLGRTTNQPLDNTTRNPDGTVAHVGTNQIGRYAIHLHHDVGPQAGRGPGIANVQYRIVGDAVIHDRKLAITVHDTHFGVVDSNVVYDGDGSGIFLEDGSETGNAVTNNMTVGIRGTGGSPLDRGASELSPARDDGYEGDGIWTHGYDSAITDNVLTDSQRANVMVVMARYPVHIPKYAGADTAVSGQYDVRQENTGQDPASPHTDMSRNTMYGNGLNGMELWGSEQISVKDTKAWHLSLNSVWSTYSTPINWVNLTVLGDSSVMNMFSDWKDVQVDFRNSSYTTYAGVVTGMGGSFVNLDVENCYMGVVFTDQMFIANHAVSLMDGAYLRNTVNVFIQSFDDYYAIQTVKIIRNLHSVAPVGHPLVSINMSSSLSYPSFTELGKRSTYLIDYQGVPGSDFELFQGLQNPSAVVPDFAEVYNAYSQTTVADMSDPHHRHLPLDEVGLTNAQTWSRYQEAIFGKIATCTDQIPEVEGYTYKRYDMHGYLPSDINEAYVCPMADRQIAGRVTDSQGNPVAGTTVQISTFRNRFEVGADAKQLDPQSHDVFPAGQGPAIPVDTSLPEVFSPYTPGIYEPDLKTVTDANGNYRIAARVTLGDQFSITALKPNFTSDQALQKNVREDRTVNMQINPGGGNGLTAEFRTSTGLKTRQTDPQINDDWTSAVDRTLTGADADVSKYNVIWHGEVVPKYTEDYMFYAGAYYTAISLQVGATVYQYSTNAAFTDLAPLVAGQHYPITLTYAPSNNYTYGGTAYNEEFPYLAWSSPSTPQEVVPQSQLYTDGTFAVPDTGTVCLNLDYAIPNNPTKQRQNMVISVKPVDQQNFSGLNLSSIASASDTFGNLEIPLPANYQLYSQLAYDIFLTSPGFLNRKIENVGGGTLLTSCRKLGPQEVLVPGNFNGASNKLSVGDLVTMIRAFHGQADSQAVLSGTAFARTPLLGDLVTLIRNLNDPTLNTADF